jgi:hypothetical protein
MNDHPSPNEHSERGEGAEERKEEATEAFIRQRDAFFQHTLT